MRWRRKNKKATPVRSAKPIDPNAIPFAEGRHLGTLCHRPPRDTWGGGDQWWPMGSSTEVRGPAVVPEGMQWEGQNRPGGSTHG